MGVTIVRNDTGLDFKRIERIVKLFDDKSLNIKRSIERVKSDQIKQRGKEAYSHFGLLQEMNRIAEIDQKIEELKKERSLSENRVRDFTQGTDTNNRYSSFDTIREGSPIYAYVHQGEEKYKEQEKRINDLNKGFIDEIWLAKDISQAVEIYQRYKAALEKEVS